MLTKFGPFGRQARGWVELWYPYHADHAVPFWRSAVSYESWSHEHPPHAAAVGMCCSSRGMTEQNRVRLAWIGDCSRPLLVPAAQQSAQCHRRRVSPTLPLLVTSQNTGTMCSSRATRHEAFPPLADRRQLSAPVRRSRPAPFRDRDAGGPAQPQSIKAPFPALNQSPRRGRGAAGRQSLRKPSMPSCVRSVLAAPGAPGAPGPADASDSLGALLARHTPLAWPRRAKRCRSKHLTSRAAPGTGERRRSSFLE